MQKKQYKLKRVFSVNSILFFLTYIIDMKNIKNLSLINTFQSDKKWP